MPRSAFSTLALLAVSFLSLVGCATRSPIIPDNGVDTPSRVRAVQMQIFLDGHRFGPGVVDGHPGQFTRKALALYRESKGLPQEVTPDVGHIPPYTSYAVTTDDLARLGGMAVEPADLARQKSLPYTRLTELLAERFHTTIAFIEELNAGCAIDTLTPGEVIRVPNVQRPLQVDAFPSGYTRPPASVASTRRVVVDTRYRMLRVLEGAESHNPE